MYIHTTSFSSATRRVKFTRSISTRRIDCSFTSDKLVGFAASLPLRFLSDTPFFKELPMHTERIRDRMMPRHKVQIFYQYWVMREIYFFGLFYNWPMNLSKITTVSMAEMFVGLRRALEFNRVGMISNRRTKFHDPVTSTRRGRIRCRPW